MTIIAGFKCDEGIVICADTQETVGHAKRSIPKLRFEPAGVAHQGDGLAVAFCGSGESGPFIDKLVQNAWEDGQLGTNIDEVCEEIEKSIKRTYKEFGAIYQPGYCPSADLIYGVKMREACRLFIANGPIVNEKPNYDASGVGQYMADFIASRMYSHALNLRQCAILAAYILFQAKEHVDGCGGKSHIAILRKGGSSGVVGYRNIRCWTDLLRASDYEVGKMLMDSADIELSDSDFKKRSSLLIELMATLRTSKAGELEQHRKFKGLLAGRTRNEDFFGFPRPSGS